MKRRFLQILFFVSLLLAFSNAVSAQAADSNTPDDKNDPKGIPDVIKENLAKMRIKNEEKDYRELIGKSEEAAQLSDAINNSLDFNRKLSSDDLKKLDRLEKLVKKIRSELGAKDDDSSDETPEKESLPIAGKNLKEMTSDLVSEIKKIGRHTISVTAIESSNSLLKLVRILRFKTD